MRTVLAAVAIIVLALGWTSQAVHVEVKWSGLSSELKQKSKSTCWVRVRVFIGSVHPDSLCRLRLAGKRPDFFSGGCQKASGAVSQRQRQRHGATEPPTSGQPGVAVQRPHAAAGVCAPVQAEERLSVLHQTG